MADALTSEADAILGSSLAALSLDLDRHLAVSVMLVPSLTVVVTQSHTPLVSTEAPGSPLVSTDAVGLTPLVFHQAMEYSTLGPSAVCVEESVEATTGPSAVCVEVSVDAVMGQITTPSVHAPASHGHGHIHTGPRSVLVCTANLTSCAAYGRP